MATFFFFITEKHKKSFETSNYYVCSQPESLYVPLLRLHLFFITFSHFPILLCLTWFCLFPYFVCVCVYMFLFIIIICSLQFSIETKKFCAVLQFFCLSLSLSVSVFSFAILFYILLLAFRYYLFNFEYWLLLKQMHTQHFFVAFPFCSSLAHVFTNSP